MPDAYKRIYELNPELTLSLTHNIAVDKNGNVSATKITITELYNIILAQLKASGDLATAGNIKMHGSNILPDGNLWCDNASYERIGIYADLFADIGTIWGSVDGDHFNVPDFRGIFPRGVGSQTIGGQTFTGVLGTIEADATARPTTPFTSGNVSVDHAHFENHPTIMRGGAANNPGVNISGPSTVFHTNGGVGFTALTARNTSGITANHTHTITGGGDSETKPASAGVNFIIKY